MKKFLFLSILLFISSVKAQTLTGIYIFQSIGGVGDDSKLTEKAKIPDLYDYKYSKNKSTLQLLTKGGTTIDTLKRKLEEYNFDYETVETTIKPTRVSYYKDFITKKFERIYTINGEESFVKDLFPKINWKIIDETKIINGYECVKATAERKILNHTLKLTTWFCDKIPVNDGPLDYTGLPGFIMELSADGLFIIKFVDLKYNPNKTIEIKPEESKEQPQTIEQFEKRY